VSHHSFACVNTDLCRFVRCLREFVKPPPNRSVFEDFFTPALPRLSQDVVDVRLALAQVVADLFIIGVSILHCLPELNRFRCFLRRQARTYTACHIPASGGACE
jgi:hypothetical protein